MSNEITIQALLAQTSGSTIGTFVPDDRLVHTIENIRNGDIITEELLTDMKKRQDDIDTVITNVSAEAENISLWDSIAYYNEDSDARIRSRGTYSSPPTSEPDDLFFTLVKLNDSGEIVFESKALFWNQESETANVFLTKKPYFDHINAYKWNSTNSNYAFYRTFELENITDTIIKLTFDGVGTINPDIVFTSNTPFQVVSNYITLDPAVIQAGQPVDGLDALIQDNELDFNNRTKLIIEYTKQ